MSKVDFGRYCAETLRRDGVVRLPGVLDAAQLALIEDAHNYRIENPGPSAQGLYKESDKGVFFNERSETPSIPCQRVLKETPVCGVVAGLFRSGPVWFHEEQVWLKDSRGQTAPSRRTPWHQDSAYKPFSGFKSVVVWINLNPVPKAEALEFVRGSHLGSRYNACAFHPDDDTAPLYPNAGMPRLPNLEAEREKWDIVSWPAEPGDILVFQDNTLHGGAPTLPGSMRRSFSLRFIGDDLVKKALPLNRNTGSDLVSYGMGAALDALAEGQPCHEAGLLEVHPGNDD